VDHVQASLGAFYRTPLEKHLRDLRASTVVVCGCNFPNCPRATIYEASERDLRIAFVLDATSGVYQRGLRELENIGVKLVSVDELLQKLIAEFSNA
jgi:nicotinamidase-related amidase